MWLHLSALIKSELFFLDLILHWLSFLSLVLLVLLPSPCVSPHSVWPERRATHTFQQTDTHVTLGPPLPPSSSHLPPLFSAVLNDCTPSLPPSYPPSFPLHSLPPPLTPSLSTHTSSTHDGWHHVISEGRICSQMFLRSHQSSSYKLVQTQVFPRTVGPVLHWNRTNCIYTDMILLVIH